MPTNNELMMLFLLQLTAVLVACRLVGMLFRRFGQPQVVGDMVAGFLLGPTLLGYVFPALSDELFPRVLTVPGTAQSIQHPALTTLFVVGQLGLVLYMFLVGLAFDHRVMARHLKASTVSSVVGIVAPVLVGGALGWYLAGNGDTFFPGGVAAWQAALFVGAACSITAFPMLARMIYERGLTRTTVGTVALACAAVDDAAAWILLALVVAGTTGDPALAVMAIGGSAVYVAVLTVLKKRAARHADRLNAPRTVGSGAALGAVAVVLLLCATFTEWVGVHAVFGAFVLGVCTPRGAFADNLRARLEPVTVHILLPVFFVYAGLNTRLDVLLDPAVLVALVLVLVVAFAVKGGACALAWRATGGSWRDAASLGSLMNARGLMELVLLHIGREKGLITDELYTVLALMTVVTSLAATPLYEFIQRRWPAPDALPHDTLPHDALPHDLPPHGALPGDVLPGDTPPRAAAGAPAGTPAEPAQLVRR
ncbi:cation:proton antiporter [Streptomyces sp. NPDC012888]|uniref:cation:proton antiporter n=1 Tax=Streptomyces sp. NPDC012888 TaxID=3364855 RepID=UPI00367AE8DE